MAEYIEREVLIAKINAEIRRSPNSAIYLCEDGVQISTDVGYVCDWFNDYADVLRRMPKADVVEVVRCKDCDKSVPSNLLGCGWRFCKNNSQHHKDEHFCSYGERRTDHE